MDSSETQRLESRARSFEWSETRRSGSTSLDVSVIATEIFEGWDVQERILGEDMRWYSCTNLTDYRRCCYVAEMMKLTQEY